MGEASVISLFNNKEGREDFLILSVRLFWAPAVCHELYEVLGLQH